MIDFTKTPHTTDTLPVDIPAELSACLDQFSKAFNRENRSDMDDQCHFPHYLISETSVTVWNNPGQIPADFFDRLKDLGWAYTTCEKCVPILSTENKIHFLWSYTRRKADGTIISAHENLWIALKINQKWGITVRSY